MGEFRSRQSEKGFTLLETMIAIVVLAVGILGLAAMLGDAFTYMRSAQQDFIAQQKAEEALEAIFTAKYDNTIGFAQIGNTSAVPPGIFLTGAQPILQPGIDGLVGTLADAGAPDAYVLDPGPDGMLGTADDVKISLVAFTRTITITDVEPNLKQVDVEIDYTAGRFSRKYDVKSFVSAF